MPRRVRHEYVPFLGLVAGTRGGGCWEPRARKKNRTDGLDPPAGIHRNQTPKRSRCSPPLDRYGRVAAKLEKLTEVSRLLQRSTRSSSKHVGSIHPLGGYFEPEYRLHRRSA